MGSMDCCKNCKDRIVGCHSTCRDYKEYKEKLAEIKKFMAKDPADAFLAKTKVRAKAFVFERKDAYNRRVGNA